MAIPSFFKAYKPRQFEYTPRYYDERKEALNERIRRIEVEMGVRSGDGTMHRTLSKGVMQDRISRKRKASRKSSLTLFLITVILLTLAYVLLYR